MAKKKTIKIQTLIFNKKYWKTKRKIREFIKSNNFVLPKKKDPIRKYTNTYKVRQRDPSRFKKTTLRTYDIKINNKPVRGVKKLCGYLK